MSNRVIPANAINPNATIAPGVVIIESLVPGNINGIPTNLVGAVGSCTWGAVNAPSFVSTPNDFTSQFGSVQTPMVTGNNYDLGTFVNAAYLQGAVASYVCVRVTDGTDASAFTDLLDTQSVPGVGAVLSGKYTGTTGNTLQATLSVGNTASSYTLTIGRPGYAAEIFSNISASGGAQTFWNNLILAVNHGQSGIRGPSNLVSASLPDEVSGIITAEGSGYTAATVSFVGGDGTGATGTAVLGYGIASITVGTPGIYSTIPSVTASVGTGATFSIDMKGVSNTVVTPQSGGGSYAPADTFNIAGGTAGTTTVLTVTTTKVISATIAVAGTSGTPGTATVTGTTGTGTKFQANVTISGGGAITAINSITVAGSYTANPSTLTAEPVTGASLSGAELSVVMGINVAAITTPGSYTVLPTNPVAQGSTSGSGTGATFNLSWGVGTVNVLTPGQDYDNTSVLAFSGTGGAVASIVLASTGGVKAINMTDHGTGYTVAPTIVITGNGTGAAATAIIGSATLPNVTHTSLNPYLFTGGLDGNSGLTSTDLLGVNSAIPTGMYCLANSNCTVFALVGNDDSMTFSDQVAFAGINATQALIVGPPSQSIADSIALKASVGLDAPENNSFMWLVGDWMNWLDVNNNGIVRLITPQAFYGGLVGNLQPSASVLNKQVQGIISTQKSAQGQVYSDADIVSAMQNGIDVIGKPSPGGNYFSCQTGKSGGTDLTTNDMDIQRMANFLSVSFAESGVLGAYIGQLQTPTAQQSARAALSAFLQNLVANQQIQAFSVVLDGTNNPINRVQLGFMQANVTVQLFSVIIVFLIDLNVGTSAITSITTTAQS